MSFRKVIAFLLLCTLIINACGKKSGGGTPPPPPPPTPPGCASNTAPANGSFVTGTTVTLSWSSVSGATGYDVYLGASASPTTVVASNVSATSYNYVLPGFANSERLYWYVQPKNATGAATGCATTVTSFVIPVIQAPPAFGYYVVGYLPSYRSIADIPDVKFRMTNVIVYAFYTVNSSGTLSAPSSPASTLSAVATKARANNAKIFVGINDGSGDGKTNFKNMAATATGRNNFIKDVMNVVRNNNLDGVDMDWEFPTTSDGTDGTFTLLMKELSDSLHRDARYYLSSAVTAGKYAGGIRDAIRNAIFPYVDFFNFMALDVFYYTVA